MDAPAPDAERNGVRYIESSALLAALLERDAAALKSVRARGRQVTSALTITESARAILRARLGARLTGDEQPAAVRALRRFERRSFVASPCLVAFLSALPSPRFELCADTTQPTRAIDATTAHQRARMGLEISLPFVHTGQRTSQSIWRE